jgi:hypothetical protein
MESVREDVRGSEGEKARRIAGKEGRREGGKVREGERR